MQTGVTIEPQVLQLVIVFCALNSQARRVKFRTPVVLVMALQIGWAGGFRLFIGGVSLGVERCLPSHWRAEQTCHG